MLNDSNYFHDKCNINYNSSGEPYILYNNFSLIGIHIGYNRDKNNKDNEKNVGVFIKDIINYIKNNPCININRIKKAEILKVVLLGESGTGRAKLIGQICRPKYAHFNQSLTTFAVSYSD